MNGINVLVTMTMAHHSMFRRIKVNDHAVADGKTFRWSLISIKHIITTLNACDAVVSFEHRNHEISFLNGTDGCVCVVTNLIWRIYFIFETRVAAMNVLFDSYLCNECDTIHLI